MKRNMFTVAMIMSTLVMAGCNNAEEAERVANEAAAIAKDAQARADAAEAAADALAIFSQEKVCLAGIATMMARDPSTIKVAKEDAGVTYLSYVREEDQTKWSWRCKIDGARIIWATDTGRWRTHSADEVLTYGLDGSNLKIVYAASDGTLMGQESFQPNQLAK